MIYKQRTIKQAIQELSTTKGMLAKMNEREGDAEVQKAIEIICSAVEKLEPVEMALWERIEERV